jgi:hypothetical protein
VPPEKLRIEDADFDAHTGLLTFKAQDKAGNMTARPSPPPTMPSPIRPRACSPDGRWRVVYRAYNLYAVDVKSGHEVPLTTDGTREEPYGREIAPLMDIIKQNTEEPVLPVSAQWSPDSRYLLSWRLDTRCRAAVHHPAEPSGSFTPHTFHYIYPLAGAKMLPLARRMVVDVPAAMKTGKARIVPIDMPAEALLYPAAPDLGWEHGLPHDLDGARLCAAGGLFRRSRNRRHHGSGRGCRCAGGDGHLLGADPGAATAWRAGDFRKVGLGAALSGAPRCPQGRYPLTKGNWEVLSVDHIAEDGHDLIVTGVGREASRNPYWRSLYRVTLDGSAPWN